MKRDWTSGRAKLQEEGRCRACHATQGLQSAHIIPRSRIPGADAMRAENQIPLCQRCHALQHDHKLELLPLLTKEEQSFVAGLVGIGEAYRRTTNRRAA